MAKNRQKSHTESWSPVGSQQAQQRPLEIAKLVTIKAGYHALADRLQRDVPAKAQSLSKACSPCKKNSPALQQSQGAQPNELRLRTAMPQNRVTQHTGGRLVAHSPATVADESGLAGGAT
jgi:hypothetical protein